MSESTAVEVFSRYEALKRIIADAEAELDELKPEVVRFVPEGSDVETEHGTFLIQSRATWKFSKDHEEKKKNLKELEEEEKAKGVAKATYQSILVYKPKKLAEQL